MDYQPFFANCKSKDFYKDIIIIIVLLSIPPKGVRGLKKTYETIHYYFLSIYGSFAAFVSTTIGLVGRKNKKQTQYVARKRCNFAARCRQRT